MKDILITIIYFGLVILFILKVVKPFLDKIELKIHNWIENRSK